MSDDFWRKCSSCKNPIGLGADYWVCSVSTCTRPRTGLVFCSVACFDAHVPMMRHRDAGALEMRAPMVKEEEGADTPRAAAPVTAGTRASSSTSAGPSPTGEVRHDVLVVVSKTKDYVRASSGLNTSDAVMAVLSDKVRELLDAAIRHAIQDGRKTVLDRDFH